MRRRMIGLSGLLAALLLVVSAGCETLRPSARSHKKADEIEKSDGSEPRAIDGDATKIQGFDSEGKTTAGSPSFFKNSRLPGALSAEGREIEQSLGVH